MHMCGHARLIHGLLVGVLLLSAGPSVAAQSPLPGVDKLDRKGPPTKKTKDGVCYVPGTSTYARIKDFIPFVALTDCIKSGGRLPQK